MKREQIKAELTAREVSFEVVIGRLKMAIGAASDSALCQALGMATNTFANRKNSGSIPFDQVIALCLDKSISIDWIFTGYGAAFKDGRAVNAPELVDRDLLVAILVELQKAWNGNSDQQFSEFHIARLGILACGIYNSRVFESDPKKQAAAVRDDAQSLARLASLTDEAEKAAKR